MELRFCTSMESCTLDMSLDKNLMYIKYGTLRNAKVNQPSALRITAQDVCVSSKYDKSNKSTQGIKDFCVGKLIGSLKK